MNDRIAEVLVRYSAAVRPGEVVSLLGPPEVEPLLRAIYEHVLKAGGHPIVVMQSEGFDELLSQHGNAEQLAFVDPLAAREVEVADVAIHVLTVPERPCRDTPGRRALLERFSQRVAQRELRWTATVAPTRQHELEGNLARAMYLDQPDPIRAWEQQRERQARLIDVLEQTRELRFVTPWDTDLRVGVAGCKWHNGDGHENFPDGEVWTCPLPDSVEGKMEVDFPYRRGRVGTRLTFRSGRIVDALTSDGQSALSEWRPLDTAAIRVSEVALGCNYAIKQPMLHTMIDEKAGGTFHIALGAANQAGLHMDLITDLRRTGRIEADGRPISINGRFVDPSWPGDNDP
jgi:aminopeptidase